MNMYLELDRTIYRYDLSALYNLLLFNVESEIVHDFYLGKKYTLQFKS